MPSKHKRVRIERGLYRQGDVFYACVTAAGSRTATWKSLGAVGIMEARRRRDKFAAELQKQRADAASHARDAERGGRGMAARAAAAVGGGRDVGADVEIYEIGLRRHVLPVLGRRQVRSVTADELVRWIRQMRARYAPHTVHNYSGALHLVLAYAAGSSRATRRSA